MPKIPVKEDEESDDDEDTWGKGNSNKGRIQRISKRKAIVESDDSGSELDID